MANEPEQQPQPFLIEGPDADGFVWICSDNSRDVWRHNLGRVQDAAETMSQWLGSIDYDEQS